MTNVVASKRVLKHVRHRFRKTFQPARFVPDVYQHAFVASYPRSGNTWMRCVLFHYTLGRAPQNLEEIDHQVPDEHTRLDLKSLITEEGPDPDAPRLVKTHAMFRVDRGYRRAVHIVRNPRNVIPSYFRFSVRKNAGLEFEEFAENCVLGGIWPGCWHSHTNAWMEGTRDRIPNLCTVRYEDLVANNMEAIEAFAQSLGLQDPNRLSVLMKEYDLEKMRGLEASGNRANEPAYKDNGQNFIGTGKAPSEQHAFVHDLIRSKAPHWEPLLERLNYTE